MAATRHTAVELVRRLTEIGAALSAEKDSGRLMELILRSAKELTGADGGSLYQRTEDDELRFEIMLTDSLGIHVGGTAPRTMSLPSVPLYAEDGSPNEHMVAAWAAVSGETVNLADAYDPGAFDFSGTREFDRQTGRLKEQGHAAPDLFEVFMREGIYQRYAQQYLPPEQVDEVDVSRIPGYASE